MKRHFTPQANRPGKVTSRRKYYLSSAVRRAGINGGLNRFRVERRAVALRSVSADIDFDLRKG